MTTELMNETAEIINVNATLLNQLYIFALSIAFVVAIYTLFMKDFRLKEESSKLIFVLFLFLISITLATFQILKNVSVNYFIWFIILLIILIFIIGFKNEEKKSILIIISIILSIVGYMTISNDIILSFVSYSAFGLGWIVLFYIFSISYSKIYQLREKRILKHFWPFNKLDDLTKSIKKEQYELKMDERKIDEKTFKSLPIQINTKLSKLDLLKESGYSFLLIFDERINPLNYGLMFALDGLDNGEYINYVCVDKHPYEVYRQVENIKKFDVNSFIFIDVFSPNFGFDDGIRELINNNLPFSPTCFTY